MGWFPVIEFLLSNLSEIVELVVGFAAVSRKTFRDFISVVVEDVVFVVGFLMIKIL